MRGGDGPRTGPRPTRKLLGGSRLPKIALLTAFAAATILPLLVTLNTSLKSHADWIRDPFSVAFPPSLDSLTDVWNRALLPGSVLNSLLITSLGVVSLWVVCVPAAFAVTRLHFPGRDLALLLLLAAVLVPLQTILQPLFALANNIGLVDQYYGLAIAYVAFGVPLTTFQLAAYFKYLPSETLEAARIDGASTLSMIWHVVLPMSGPVLATTGIINFVWIWNDLLLVVLLTSSPRHQTLTATLALIPGQYGVSAPILAASAIVGILPIAAFYLIAQRHIVRGLTAGAVK